MSVITAHSFARAFARASAQFRSSMLFAMVTGSSLFLITALTARADAPSDQSIVGAGRSIAGEATAGIRSKDATRSDEYGNLPTSVRGMENAEGHDLAEAQGHYARSRALLVAAIREFDKAYEIANPDLLLDSKMWRSTLVTRARDLEKIIDPQARSSAGAVRFEPNSALVGAKR